MLEPGSNTNPLEKPSWKPVHEGLVEEVLVVKVCQAFSCKNYNMNSEQVN